MQRRRCLPALTQENAEGLAKQMSNPWDQTVANRKCNGIVMGLKTTSFGIYPPRIASQTLKWSWRRLIDAVFCLGCPPDGNQPTTTAHNLNYNRG